MPAQPGDASAEINGASPALRLAKQCAEPGPRAGRGGVEFEKLVPAPLTGHHLDVARPHAERLGHGAPHCLVRSTLDSGRSHRDKQRRSRGAVPPPANPGAPGTRFDPHREPQASLAHDPTIPYPHPVFQTAGRAVGSGAADGTAHHMKSPVQRAASSHPTEG